MRERAKAQRWIGVIVLGACLLAARVASADDPREAAKQHFAAGEAKYKGGDYPGAIAEFMAADALVPSPILSFNIALCHEKLGNKVDAAKLYRDYLARRPDAPNRSTVEARISALDAEIAAAAAAQPPVDNTPPPDTMPGGTEMPPDVLDNATPPAEATPPPAEPGRRAYDDALARRVPERGAVAANGGYPAPAGDPGAPPAGGSPPEAPAPRATPVYKQWWFWVVVGVSALIIIDVMSGPESNNNAAQGTGAVLWRF
jgi:hypothetical protein